MPVWEKYKSLSPRTRIAIGGGIMLYATIAIYASDAAEKVFGLEAREEDKQKLGALLPKIEVQTMERERSRRGREAGSARTESS